MEAKFYVGKLKQLIRVVDARPARLCRTFFTLQYFNTSLDRCITADERNIPLGEVLRLALDALEHAGGPKKA